MVDAVVDAREQVMALLNQMRDAVANPMVHERLSDQMEVLVRSYFEPIGPGAPLPGVKMTESEARIWAMLSTKINREVRKDSLADALYFDAECEPNLKIIDVFICRLRSKIKGSGFHIETVWGKGYRLRMAD